MLCQDEVSLKGPDLFFIRCFIPAVFKRIHWNKINLGLKPFEHLDEVSGIGDPVVYALDEDIFNGDSSDLIIFPSGYLSIEKR